ncbi:MAG: DNA methylase [Candidatus Nitrosocaldaceae archaeon]|nr:MAG: DNA methylase [Candidatus Nitrosocaldaceae archaeon]
MDKALIEKGSIELVELFDLVSEEAAIEKLGNAKPPINQILYWWTRKPLIVSRAITLLSILPYNTNPFKARLLLNLDSDKRAYTHKLNLSSLYDELSIDPSSIKVLDPFAGAGNLIFEAKQFGFDCYASDYNPVAYLIEKAVLEYPSKYPNLARDVEYYANKVIDMTKKELGHLYHRDGRKALAYLYSWCILCPYCKQRIPLMNHSYFAKTDKKKIGIRVKPNNKDFVIELINNISKEEGEKFTQKGGRAICINCKSSIDYDYLTNDIANRKDYAMIGVVVQGLKGKDYELPSEDDIRAFNEAKKLLEERWKEFEDEGLIPFEERIFEEERKNMPKYGIKYWYQHFNYRQLLLMLTLLRNIRSVCSDIKDKEYAKVIAAYLAFMLCKHIDRNSISVGWDVTNQQIAHALTMRSPRIIYNFAETNPFEETSGSLKGMLDNIINAIKFASNKSNAKVSLASVLHLPYDKEFDLIITDPPYLDDVAYGEISEFFYVWLYRALKDYYPELPNRVPLDEDIVLSKGRFGNKELAYQFYKKAMKQAFKNIHKALKDDGLAVIFFAHSSIKAWNLLLDILREARFQVTSSYAIHTENEQNVLARNKTSFMSSIVIACRKISKDREAYLEDLIPAIEDKIDELLKGIKADKLLALPITDLLIMIYGEVLEVATAYTKLKSYSKDTSITFEDIIDNARDYMLRAVIKKLIDRDLNIIGAEAAFYIIAKVFFNGIIPADDTLHITRTYNIDENRLKSIAKKEKGITKLLSFKDMRIKELEDIDANNIHEQLMFIEQLAYKDGARKVKSIINAPNFKVNELKSIIALLIKYYNISKNKGRKLSKDEEDEYNILLALADVLDLKVDSANKRLDDYA